MGTPMPPVAPYSSYIEKLIKLFLLALCLFLSALPQCVRAQDSKPLLIPFTPVPPFMQYDRDGKRTGYFVELAELITSEINRPIKFVDADNMRQVTAMQMSGQTDMLAGVVSTTALSQSNLLSSTVASEPLRLAVLAKNAKQVSKTKEIAGWRIGIVPPASGYDQSILTPNTPVRYDSAKSALVDLLLGNLDALLLPNPYLYRLTRSAGVDDLIVFLNTPVSETTRVVALHKKNEALIDPINQAIAKLSADGRLQELKRKYLTDAPAPPPTTLKVAVAHIPPYMEIRPDGSFGGFGVDVFKELAQRAGLSFEFKKTSLQELGKGPRADHFDILPVFTASDDRKKKMDFTFPIRTVLTSIITRSGEPEGITGLEDLQGKRVGSLANLKSSQRVQANKNIESKEFETTTKLLEGLLDGTVDAIVTSVNTLTKSARKEGVLDEISIVSPPLDKSEVAIALRFGLGGERERLNALIPGFLLSDRYEQLEQDYFGEPVFWTQQRLMLAWWIAGAVALLALITIVILTLRSRAKEKMATAVGIVRDELETVFNTVTSGIVAFDSQGLIVRINNRARHYLGGITATEPFNWPKNIEFIDGNSLQPLDPGTNPIQRILSSKALKQKSHLMRRAQDGDNFRYVRLESAQVQNAASNVAAVLIIDDVSSEERNRQVLERKHRLDALGQLTGGIAHDFNNLLASQMYAVDLARRAKDDAKRNKYLEIAVNSIMRAKALTSRLLAFARRQPGLAIVRDTEEVLDDFFKLVRPMLEEQFEIKVTIEDEELYHYCDQIQLESALMNLVLNSRDAMLRSGKGHQIEIKARGVHAPQKDLDSKQHGHPKTGSLAKGTAFRYVEISVSDDGPGMDEETLTRCTDPFFTTKDATASTGLGLAMVYGFARQADGSLRIYSEPGVGTTVQLTLPRGNIEGTREEPMLKEEPESGKGQIILVVEDEEPLLQIMEEVLTNLGYQTLTAKSGRAAIEIAESGQPFDLLLTDIVMPGNLNGFQIAQKMRESTPDLPVLYMSGYTGFSSSEMGEVKAPLLQKPTPPEQLAEALANSLAQA